MRRGFYPSVYFSGDKLIAFGTGSDACAEHECGARPLIESLCSDKETEKERKALDRLRKGKKAKYPSVIEMKRVVKTPETLRFVVLEPPGEEPEAILGVIPAHYEHYLRSELDFSRFSSNKDPNVAGAWDERSFAIRVRGERYVNGLEGFYKAMRQKKVLFGGKFFSRDTFSPSGVILTDSDGLDAEDRKRIVKAQSDYESALRLRVRDDSGELSRQIHQVLREAGVLTGSKKFLDVGYIWVRWKDPSEQEIVYCLNPGYEINAKYWGPYTREELLAWARAKLSYRLTPKAALAA